MNKIKMMRKFLLGLAIFGSVGVNAQQEFSGYRTSNYTGVNGVFFNPANIADSRYRWDVNLFSINAGVGNNNAAFKLKNLSDIFKSGDDLTNQLFGDKGKTTNGTVNLDIFGPSFMFNVKKLSFALTSRVRTMANIKDIDGEFINAINKVEGMNAFTLNTDKNQKIVANGWGDFGVSMGLPLMDNGKHFLKGGITVKYLAGVVNSFANVNKLHAEVDEETSGNYYIHNATGIATVGYTGIDNFDNIKAKDAKINGHGFGGDLGLVYEYRPDATKTGADENKYKFKVALSLLDIGSIKYNTKKENYGSYNIHVPVNGKWYPKDLDGKSMSEIRRYLDENPAYFTNTTDTLASYKANLPTTLQANVDVNVASNFYVDLGGQLNLAKKDNLYSSYYYNGVTLTPRYENKLFGVSLPINYNELTNFNAGISLRFGPLFVGSGSVITALIDKSKQLDAHFGLRFGMLRKKAKAVKEATIVVAPPPAVQTKKPVDTDGDGINDENDKCPTLPGTAKYKGCPVPDSDGDGIDDENDKCPDTRGTAKYQGCPVPDTDGDGVNDEEDKCPTVAGTVANHGCPEVKQEVVKKVNVVAKTIQFQTGKAVLTPSSYKGLNELATIMKQDQGLKVNVEGHTDNVGNDALNEKLSQKRADAVKAYLIKKGVSEDRLSAMGYGESKPIADNKTAAGRAKNRRVELKPTY